MILPVEFAGLMHAEHPCSTYPAISELVPDDFLRTSSASLEIRLR